MSSKKENKFPVTIVSIGVALLALGLFAVLNPGKESRHEESTTGKLVASESSWNLGTVSMKDGLNEKIVKLKNETDSPVTITEMETSCMCTKASIRNEDGTMGPTKGMVGHGGSPRMSQVIAPGETADLIVVYDPNAHGPNAVGPITRSITLKTNSSEQPSLDFRFRAVVTK